MVEKNFEIVKSCYVQEEGSLHVRVKGKPVVWQRCIPRWSLNKMWNGNQKLQEKFHKMLCDKFGGSMELPIFKAKEAVEVKMIFSLERPGNQFKAKTKKGSSIGRIYRNIFPSALKKWPTVGRDVDNLAKWLMDRPFKGVFINDDAQIVHLDVWKKYDNRGNCNGHIDIIVKKASSPQESEVKMDCGLNKNDKEVIVIDE